MSSFANTRNALSKIVSHPAQSVDERLVVELAAALGELVKELERRLDELRRKVDMLALRSD